MANETWMWWSTPPYTAPVSEFTAPEDVRRQRLSAAFPWHPNPSAPQMSWEFQGPLLQRWLTDSLLLGLGAVRAPVAPRAAPAAAPAAPQGPWEPSFMTQWLQGRYQPAARPQPWQADRRWGTLGNQPPSASWADVVRGRFFVPRNLRDGIEYAKGAGAVGAAAGVGASGGMYLTDTFVHGLSPSEVAWRALIGPGAGEPPSWWPRADETAAGGR